MRLVVLALTMTIAACGGRVAHPVALEGDFDDRLGCAHMAGEYANNIKRLEELTGESKEKFANNLGLLITSPLFLDFSDTQKREAEAILARNERLLSLMAERGCQTDDTPDAPADAQEGATQTPEDTPAGAQS